MLRSPCVKDLADEHGARKQHEQHQENTLSSDDAVLTPLIDVQDLFDRH